MASSTSDADGLVVAGLPEVDEFETAAPGDLALVLDVRKRVGN